MAVSASINMISKYMPRVIIVPRHGEAIGAGH